MPDADEGIGAQERHDLLAEGDIERRVAEHGGHVHRELRQEPPMQAESWRMRSKRPVTVPRRSDRTTFHTRRRSEAQA